MDGSKLKTIVEEVVNKAVDPIKKDLAGVKETLKAHTRKLDALAGDMEQVLSEVKATHDEIGLWHQRDKQSFPFLLRKNVKEKLMILKYI